MGEQFNQGKLINGLGVERRERLAAANSNASAMGLSFKLIDEHLVANTEETDKKIEQIESVLKEFEIIRRNYNSKLDKLSQSVFSGK